MLLVKDLCLKLIGQMGDCLWGQTDTGSLAPDNLVLEPLNTKEMYTNKPQAPKWGSPSTLLHQRFFACGAATSHQDHRSLGPLAPQQLRGFNASCSSVKNWPFSNGRTTCIDEQVHKYVQKDLLFWVAVEERRETHWERQWRNNKCNPFNPHWD